MIKKLDFKPFVFGLPILVILFLFALPRFIGLSNISEYLSIGILLDLLITVPLIYYLIIRKRNIPKFTLIYPFIIGILIASLIIPIEHQQLLSQIKTLAIPIIELGFLSMILYKISLLNKSFQHVKEVDFYNKLLIACNEIFPNRIGKILATEIAVFHFLCSFNKADVLREFQFSTYKKSGITTVIGVFVFLLVVEVFLMHILIAGWSNTLAWILSLIGIYTILQVIAIVRSLSKRPLAFDDEKKLLHLNYGFACYTSIPYDQISNIEISRRRPTNDKSHACLSIFNLLDSTNLVINLNTKNTLHKIYGINKSYKSISLFVDEREKFVEKIGQVCTF